MVINLKEKFLKTLYRTVTAILTICWILAGFCLVGQCASKAYLYPLKFKDIIFEYADYYGLERALIFSVVKVESNFNEKAVSAAGAVGLMQITPDTGKYIAEKSGVEKFDLTDAKTNVNFGCYYLKYLFLRFDDMDTAIVAYNAGEGNVSLWLNDADCSLDKKTLFHIPFSESREYIKKIKETFSKYEKLYGNILDKS